MTRSEATITGCAQAETGTKPVHLCWSSGWDSTFRLLTLVCDLQRHVQPIYVRDPKRRSHPRELAAMDDIRAELVRFDAAAAARLLPVQILERRECEMPDLMAHYRDILARAATGTQYPWFAGAARLLGDVRLEVGVTGDGPTVQLLRDRLEDIERDGEMTWQLALRHDGSAEEAIFGTFLMPMIPLFKDDMEKRACERGWMDIMKLTWFCHRPLRSGAPCGTCTPCIGTISEGYARRVGWRGYLRNRLALHRRLRFHLILNVPLYRRARAWKRRLMPWAVPPAERAQERAGDSIG